MAENSTDRVERLDLVITRLFDAPVERVWSAWTDPAQVVRWWGPNGFTAPSAVMDVREGGVSLLCMRAPRELGGADLYSTWEYRAVVPGERLELIHNLADGDGRSIDPVTIGMPSDFPRNQHHTIRFTALDDGRTRLTVTEYGWPVGRMMEMSEMGMEQCLDKMATIVEEGGARYE